MPVSLRHVGAEGKNDHSNSLDEVDRGEVRQLTKKAVTELKWLPEQSKTTTLRHGYAGSLLYYTDGSLFLAARLPRRDDASSP